jgi:hypothetical protein
MFFLVFVAQLVLAYSYIEDPTMVVSEDYPTAYIVFFGLSVVLLVVITVYVIVLSIQFCADWKLRIQRHKVFLITSLFFMALHDITILGEAQSYYVSDSGLLFTSQCILNLYIWVLVYLYNISK